jgi:hypothetical protein
LPQFSKKPKEVEWIATVNIFDGIRENELKNKIHERSTKDSNKSTAPNKSTHHKVEHSYINLSIVQLSCKLNHKDTDLKEYQQMNGLALSKLFHNKVRHQQFEFFKFKIIQEIIDLQWKEARKMMKGMFVMFFFFYFIPIVSICVSHSKAVDYVKEQEEHDEPFILTYGEYVLNMSIFTEGIFIIFKIL